MKLSKMLVGLSLLAACGAVLAIALGPTVPTAEGQEGAKYKGSKACKLCHDKEHEGSGFNPWTAWQEMKHAKAIESLTAEQIASGKDHKGRACVQCHTTGYGKGGFESKEKTPKLANVGCESCHGPGSLHITTMVMAEDEKVDDMKISKSVGCVQCHNPHDSHKKRYGKKE
ncbi:MAG: multiheme c-type cytochrome [Planctomycetota bacterium]|jgi:hypothetical protein